MPTETADDHLKMEKQLHRMPRPYLMIALFVFFPSCDASATQAECRSADDRGIAGTDGLDIRDPDVVFEGCFL
jgi:hypothetical protein